MTLPGQANSPGIPLNQKVNKAQELTYLSINIDDALVLAFIKVAFMF
jgi:hypothetical protein